MSHPNTEDPAPSQSDTVRATMGHCPSTLLIALLIAQLRLRQGQSFWHCQRLAAIFSALLSTFNSFNRPNAKARTSQNLFECAFWASFFIWDAGNAEPASCAEWLSQLRATPHSLCSPPVTTVWMQPLLSQSFLLFSFFFPALPAPLRFFEQTPAARAQGSNCC